jgi:GDP-4-dehydro-6-deoxy-D-mannose reductase
MRTLVTGATGFVGGHLVERLLAAGDEVHGLTRRSTWPPDLAHLAADVPLYAADLSESERAKRVLAEVRPERIAHLAGFADAGGSFRDPAAAWAGNLDATRNLCDAVVAWGGGPRILLVSTGQVYGPSDLPIDESAELRPASPYAASKAAADLFGYQVTRHPGLDIVRVRPFNQVGPRQPPQYAAGHFARQLARIEAGLDAPRLEVGDLTARRDLTDVRDMAEAFRLLLDRGRTGEVYNAGSGAAVSMADVLDLLRAECRTPVEVVPRPERMRPADPSVIVADAGKLRRETGWTPRNALPQTLRDTLDWWRNQITSPAAPSRPGTASS